MLSGSALVGSQAQEMIVELSKIHRMHIMQLLDSLKKVSKLSYNCPVFCLLLK